MADQSDPRDQDEEMGRTNEEDITGSADDEQFEEDDEAEDETEGEEGGIE